MRKGPWRRRGLPSVGVRTHKGAQALRNAWRHGVSNVHHGAEAARLAVAGPPQQPPSLGAPLPRARTSAAQRRSAGRSARASFALRAHLCVEAPGASLAPGVGHCRPAPYAQSNWAGGARVGRSSGASVGRARLVARIARTASGFMTAARSFNRVLPAAVRDRRKHDRAN